MLSIIVAVLAVILSFFYLKKSSSKWRITIFFVLFNWLILEIGVYFYLLCVVHSGNFLFLIGDQKFLDFLIKKDITQSIITQKNPHNSFYQIDPDLGYTVGQDKSYWLYHSSAQGLRANREYALNPDPNTLRLALFGDSFVFCDGEPLEATWPYMLEQAVNGLEVINFGVSGYGLSSSYLRYLKEGQQYNPDIVFINYILLADRDWIDGSLLGGTDLRRSTLYRPLLTLEGDKLRVRHFTPLDLFKPDLREEYLYHPLKLAHSILGCPFFSFTNTGLAIKNIYLLRRFNQMLANQQKDPDYQRKRLEYNNKMIQDLLDQTLKQHATVVFFYSQDFGDLPPSLQTILLQHSSHVIYIDGAKLLNSIFNKLNLKPKDYLNSTNHYNPIGNRVYAEAMGFVLKHNHWGSGKRSFEFCASTNSFQNTAIKPCP